MINPFILQIDEREEVLFTLASADQIAGCDGRGSRGDHRTLISGRERPAWGPERRERRGPAVAGRGGGGAFAARDEMFERLQAATGRVGGIPMSDTRALVTMYAAAEDGRAPRGVVWSNRRWNRLQGSGHGRRSAPPIARSLSVYRGIASDADRNRPEMVTPTMTPAQMPMRNDHQCITSASVGVGPR